MPETNDNTRDLTHDPALPDVVVDATAPTSIALPPDGTRVRAVTIPSIEYDREAEEIEGILTTVPSPFTPTPNCYVDGLGVDEATVQAIPAAGPPDGADSAP